MHAVRLLVLFCCLAVPFTAHAAAKQPLVAHVSVALCDNIHQRIAPVPPRIGNGEDPANNLYWGALYGVKTFMRKQQGWRMTVLPSPKPHILERLAFSNAERNVVIIADAYRGNAIKDATMDFLRHAAGKDSQTVMVGDTAVNAGGGAGLAVYIGHNGLMDFTLPAHPAGSASGRKAALFACQSKRYFHNALRATGAHPLLWTRGNMAPEAYVLEALVATWARGANDQAIQEAVAQAYNTYQKCGIRGARNLFATGW